LHGLMTTDLGKAATKKATTKKATAKKATKQATTRKQAPSPGALTVADLLGGKPISSFDVDSLMRKAHWRWNKDQLHEAFLLFDAAMHAPSTRTPAVTSARNRAAITLFRSGRDPDEARRRLRDVVDHYAANPTDTEDRHFVDWAMTSLIEDAAANASSAQQFTEAYRAAVAEAQVLLQNHWSTGRTFPVIHVQRLIDAAKRAGAEDIVAELEAIA
jgi:hypothetical protein